MSHALASVWLVLGGSIRRGGSGGTVRLGLGRHGRAEMPACLPGRVCLTLNPVISAWHGDRTGQQGGKHTV